MFFFAAMYPEKLPVACLGDVRKRTEFRYRKVSGVNEDIYRYNNFIKCISINRVRLNYMFGKNM